MLMTQQSYKKLRCSTTEYEYAAGTETVSALRDATASQLQLVTDSRTQTDSLFIQRQIFFRVPSPQIWYVWTSEFCV